MTVAQPAKKTPREQAVENVDRRYGYTMEFAPCPAQHKLEYDEEEMRLVDAGVNPLWTAVEVNSDVPVGWWLIRTRRWRGAKGWWMFLSKVTADHTSNSHKIYWCAGGGSRWWDPRGPGHTYGDLTHYTSPDNFAAALAELQEQQ